MTDKLLLGSSGSQGVNEDNEKIDPQKKELEMDVILKQRTAWAQSRAGHNPFARNLLKNPNMI